MKKLTIFIVLAVLCLNFKAMAQANKQARKDTFSSKLTSPIIGERLPDIYFNQILNSADHSKKLSDFKAKVIILDFWATWCSNCIKGFANLDTLQKKYGRHLQVLLVNNSSRDDLAKVAAFLDKYQIDYPNFSLPLVMGNSATKKLHSAGSLPHYLWIGYDRKVKAITGSEEIKAENIERLIAGLPLALPVKEDGHE